MNVVIDPVGVSIVGFVPSNAQIGGPWDGFVSMPFPDGLNKDTLGVTKDLDTGEYSFHEDPIKVQAIMDAKWTFIRAQQKELLYKSDWTCSVTDYSPPNKEKWVIYRQALRDVTTQLDPFNIVWPVHPSE
jgi:hypothetical protein